MKQPSGRKAGWAVVTGASSGLGREFALALAKRGQPVLAVARRGDRLRTLADEASAGGGRVEPLIADLSTAAGIETVLATAAALEVDVLVNNAGVATYGPFVSLSPERERELVRLNVEAIVALTRGPATGDARARARRPHQRRLADGLSADALLRLVRGEQGVRAQLLRGACRGGTRQRCADDRSRAGLRQHRVCRRCRQQQR